MKRQRFQRVAAAFVSAFAVVFGGLVGSASAADSQAQKATKPIVVATCPNLNAGWAAVERVAAEMKFDAVVKATRTLTEADWRDDSKPHGFVLATNGDAFVPFGFLPVSSLDEFVESCSPRIREQLEKTDSETYLATNGKFEILEKDGFMFVFQPEQKALVPTSDPTAWLGDAANDAFLTVDVDVAALPEEFVEAAFAELRQQAALGAGELGDDELASFDAVLRYYSELLASLERVVLALKVDPESGNFVANYSFKFKNGSALQETLDATKNGETRWSAFLETPNAVFASASGGKYAERDKAFLVDYYRTNVFKNVLTQLETALDDQGTLEKAREIVDALQNAALAQFESGTFDNAVALSGGDKPFVAFGAKSTNADDARRALQTLVDAVRDGTDDAAAFDEIFKFDAKTVDGFSVSTVDFPIPEAAAESAPYFAGKTLVARFGIADDALLFVAGFDAAQADAEFSRLAAGYATGTTVPNPTSASFAFAPLAETLAAVADGSPNVQPGALEVARRFAEAQDARLDVAFQIDGARLDVEYVLTAEFFAAVGDAIRTQMTGGGSVDDSEELADIFDEE